MLVLTAVLLAGCGEDSSPQTRDALQDRVGAVVVAANAGDGATARTALAALRADVRNAQRLGSLSPERSANLARLADEVEAALPAAAKAPAPAPPAPAVAPQPPRQPEPDKDAGKGGKGGKDEEDEDKDD